MLACEAMAELCQIPKGGCCRNSKRARFSIPKILEIEKRTNHDVIAFLENVAGSVVSIALDPSGANFIGHIGCYALRAAERVD